MSALMINVKIDLAECQEAVETGSVEKNTDGSLSMAIDLNDAINIDKCENAVLQVVYPSIRSALTDHLSEVSEIMATEQAGIAKEVIANETPYRVDGEAGRFTFTTHSVIADGKIYYNTAGDVFKPLIGKGYHRTVGFKEIAIVYGDTEQSFRKTGKLINRIRHQVAGGTPYKTLQENTEKEGTDLIDFIEIKTARILEENGFAKDGVYCGDNAEYADNQPVTVSESMILRAAEICLENREMTEVKRRVITDEIFANPVCYEKPEDTVNVSIDDVNTKRQAGTRPEGGSVEKGKRKYVHNTVAVVSKGDQSYILNGYGTRTVLCYLIAFLFNNSLIGRRIQFHTDGHTILNALIIKCFAWYANIGIILDWYHVVKKCKEQLSMGMKGRNLRNMILDRLLPLLWLGLTDRAIALLCDIDSAQIKNKAIIEKLKEYLKRNKPYIPCYAIRKELNLRNSSNVVEKANDMIVSSRQKHNGMSWSKVGSVALASLSALKRNNEDKNWFEKRVIEMKLAA